MTPSAPTAPVLPGAIILGTDTGAGKTTFATALLRLAHRLGLRPVPHKPVETGCQPTPDDALRLLSASHRTDLSLLDVCPVQLSLPVAPALAAEAAELTLRPAALAGVARDLAGRGNFLVVETAGGLLSPYGPRFTCADLAAALPLPIILVAPNRLGTINHACLAMAELARRHLHLAAFILVDTSPDSTPDRPHNGRLIADQTGILPLLTLPFLVQPDPDQLADALSARIAVPDLFLRLGVPALAARP
jgi:dethiobiotin synthetase